YGGFWNINTQLTNDPAISDYPKVAVSGQVVHVVWSDTRDGNYEIYYKRSSDRGVNWSLDTRLTLDANGSGLPQIAVSGSLVHLLWQDDREGTAEIYYKRSTDEGLSWLSDIRLTDVDSFLSQAPSIAVSGSIIHLIWLDDRDGDRDLYHKRSTDNGNSWSEDERLTNNPAILENHSVTVSGQAVYVVWTDYRDGGNGEIYYKCNPTGEPTDVEIINDEIPNEYILFQNFPNPFNPSTKIKFSIPPVTLRQAQSDNWVTLIVYDILGREITTLVDEEKPAGSYEVIFDGKNLPSGIYVYQLIAGNFRDSKKMLLIK
ncbi:MAG: T9SS type A sorting domain-containing protein, partial [Ignavibacteriales bacterium]